MFITAPTTDPRRAARSLYWQGWRTRDIARHLDLPRTTVESWKTRDRWGEAPAIERVEASLEARLIQLIAKEPKTGTDFKEIDLLGRQIERLARVRRYAREDGHEGDLNPKVANRNAGSRKRRQRNAMTEEQKEKLLTLFRDTLFEYQRDWYGAGLQHRIRNILKSRQIGATWYFAREALADAIHTGRNQIFLSASKSQAHVFKQYMVQYAAEAEVELSGDPMILPNGAHLYFLGTNARTAQSYHGNLYFDEYFWVHKFQELRKVASGMAMHKKWRLTYISTPSAITHDAYPFWAGELYNRGRPKAERIALDLSHSALAPGRHCEDGQWRQIVTVEDALRGGCDLFDLDQLKLEYSADEWANLLLCQFIDDTESVFPLAMMQRCFVDSWEVWEDIKPFALRPYGARPVWIGYDPGLDGDGAGCVVVAPPAVPGGKFRVLEKHRWKGQDFESQAKQIRAMTERYAVAYIAIDTTGLGTGVYQLVRKFFPAAVALNYSPAVKTELVLRALNVIGNGRLEFDAGWTDLAQSFMQIKKTLTPSGRQVTYQAGRSEATGHAELAWATMHALGNEPLGAGSEDDYSSGFMEIYS
ncbi:terminase ATPase subunit family protein [Microbulbifer discodermiae]|uniref:terminase ATPase subunit family protein n=1 Tax=Microbulbifer sp. 2201CG32-9 TaxID=3232309 RepID=UPI00345C0C50